MAAYHAKLRAERDKEAPTLRYLAEQGYNVKHAAEAMGTGEKRVRLMAAKTVSRSVSGFEANDQLPQEPAPPARLARPAGIRQKQYLRAW